MFEYTELLLELHQAAKEGSQDQYEAALNKVMRFELDAIARIGNIEDGKTLFEMLVAEEVAIPEVQLPLIEQRSLPSLFQCIKQMLFPTATHDPRLRPVAIAFAGAVAITMAIGFLLIFQPGNSISPQTPSPEAPRVALAIKDIEPAMIVLDAQGTASYSRDGWDTTQQLTPGIQLGETDTILGEDVTLRILCPSGTVQVFSTADLSSNNTITCASTNADSTLVAFTGIQPQSVQKGGIEDITVPYLISPRTTLIRTPRATLQWNPVLNVAHYVLTVRANAEPVYESEELAPEIVDAGEVAHFDLPFDLAPDVPYTVEICVLFSTSERACTTDPGITSNANLAFYYHPIPELGRIEQDLIADLGEDSPESLYARALLLSQPWYSPATTTNPMGYYQESIDLLHRIVTNYSDSSLTQSPTIYNMIGELYRRIDLPRSAARVYQIAKDFATPGTEEAAIALRGEASTTPDSGLVVNLYDSALDEYASFLNADSFEAQFKGLCRQIGGTCLALQRCQEQLAECRSWAQGDD